MNEINKLNPLLEAMNDIDDAIVSEAAPAQRRRPRCFKPMLIAAAAVLCGATAVTAAASIKPAKTYTFNNETDNKSDYYAYTDDYGREIRMYVTPIPEYALLEEAEGCTPVGRVKLVIKGEDVNPKNSTFIDEEGNTFPNGVNNLDVHYEIIEEHGHTFGGLRCANFNEAEYRCEAHCVGEGIDNPEGRIDVSIFKRNN